MVNKNRVINIIMMTPYLFFFLSVFKHRIDPRIFIFIIYAANVRTFFLSTKYYEYFFSVTNQNYVFL